jgi:hypothetical protein
MLRFLTVRAVYDGDELMIKILHLEYAMQLITGEVIREVLEKFSPHKQWVYDAIKY